MTVSRVSPGQPEAPASPQVATTAVARSAGPAMQTGNIEAASILRPGLPLARYSDHTFDVLHRPFSPESTTALHVLHATLAGVMPGTVHANPVHRNRLGVAVYDLAHRYADLAKSLETTSPEDAASATALLVESAQVLDALETPLARNLMALLLDKADHAVLSAMANRPSVATRAVGMLIELTAARFAQTGSWFYAGSDERYESQSRTRAYESFDAPLHCVSGYRRHPDYPFDELPIAALGFLGTEHGPSLRQGIVDFLLKADKGLDLLIALHQAHFITGKPPDQAPPPMGAQGDLERLLVALAWFKPTDCPGYSAALAFTQVAAIFDAVLAKVETPAMHRLVADCALTALDFYGHGKARSHEADAAADELVERLRQRGPDRETNAQMAALLDARTQLG